VLAAGGYSGRDPSQISFASGNVVTAITWSSWTATGASGSGRSAVTLCLPNCVATPAGLTATTIALSGPVNGRFTVLTETHDGASQTWNYPANWPQSAQ
jgi:hypothetical protein